MGVKQKLAVGPALRVASRYYLRYLGKVGSATSGA